MAKQTELKRLLQELEIATRTHERTNNFSTTPDECARTFHAADIAEKRVFSFFDKLNTELEDSARAYKSLQEQRNYLALERDEARKAAVAQRNVAQKAKADLQELAQQVMAMKEPVPTAPNEPFDEKRAAAGDAIEICMAPDHWIEKKFVGMIDTVARGRQVAYEHNDSLDWAPVGSARMKAKPVTQLQMFADVFKQNDTYWGQLHQAVSNHAIINAPGRELLVRDLPVTITVAK